ncbi:NfeD family protein [Pasteurella testudinis]|uniref:NfeD family protein n=1 Tax=Pasteurella testudinis TaxID=761 RepID=UPI0040594D7F
MEWFAAWTSWSWLIFAFILLIAEAIIPGIFLLWWGLAALVVAGLSCIFPLTAAWNWIIFAALAVVASIVWWRYQHRKDQQDDPHTALNQRGIAMLGQQGVIREISSNNIGRAHFGDTTWRITWQNSAYDLQIGDTVIVTAVDGITLTVEKG